MSHQILLGVNIDHVATLRQARGEIYPCPVEAALQAERAGADGITLHLREDRRHIQDADVYLMRERITTRMNLEMAVTEEMIDIATRVKPEHCCLVPEKRAEVTTEGGLDVRGSLPQTRDACERLSGAGIDVSLFIDPDHNQIDAAIEAGAPTIELHTGTYAGASSEAERQTELARLAAAVSYGAACGLVVNAGHGLNERNVIPVARIHSIRELNIGHSIISKAVSVGLHEAVTRMRELIQNC